jgi:anti-sigma regulatory factor (Ser/Thr protein kinase)
MSAIPPQPIRLSLASTPAHLPIVRAGVGEIARLVGFDEKAVDAVVLAVDEAMTNIIKHAYDGRNDQPIEAAFTALSEAADGGPAGLTIVLEDRGKPVDPAAVRSRDLDDVRPGGLGVHIMGCCMDRVDYTPREGGGTRLTMTKFLRAADKPGARQPQLTGGTRG